MSKAQDPTFLQMTRKLQTDRLFGFVGFLLGLGRAAVCDCGTPWTFLLPFFFAGRTCLKYIFLGDSVPTQREEMLYF